MTSVVVAVEMPQESPSYCREMKVSSVLAVDGYALGAAYTAVGTACCADIACDHCRPAARWVMA